MYGSCLLSYVGSQSYLESGTEDGKDLFTQELKANLFIPLCRMHARIYALVIIHVRKVPVW